ncbi:MAG: RNA polymerase sigma factor RpoD [Actinomycetota bacterium]
MKTLARKTPEQALEAFWKSARRNGFVTAEDLDELFEVAELDVDEAESTYQKLNEERIEIRDDDGSVIAEEPPSRSGARASRAADEGLRQDDLQSADPVRLYLRTISEVPLLNADQEKELGAMIQAGMAAEAELAKHARASLERVKELSRDSGLPEDHLDGRPPLELQAQLELIQARGGRARRDMIEANLRLVVSIAKRYNNRGMTFLDLIQEGNVGLIRAVEKFDHTRGFKFSTYATWWIRQAIGRAIADQARTIRIPVHVTDLINRMNRERRSLAQTLGREPTKEELAEKVGIEPGRVEELDRINQDTLSLEMPVGEEGDASLGDFIEDTESPVPHEVASFQLLQKHIREVLGELSEKERRIIEMRFGLDGGDIRTLDDVGREFGVTRERIRQIETKTLSKLRHPSRKQLLRDYLDD